MGNHDMSEPLYPALEPFATARLSVGGGHFIYFEQCGNPEGVPVLFFHGGPGSRTRPLHRTFFDPTFYRIVLFDQRGCGQSVPLGDIADNTTQRLVEDVEVLRTHLGLERLMLFGGSWGSTLALAYATTHSARVAAMVLRGVFLGSRAEVDWYLDGLRRFVPDAWETLAGGQDDHLLARYHRLVHESDESAALAAAQRWTGYEEAVMALGATQKPAGPRDDPRTVLARARVQLHYLAHDCFLAPDELLAKATRLGGVPALLVQGRLDMVCPPRLAFELARRLPRSELRLIERGGHSASEPEMAAALRRATDDMRERLQ
jgi:proline iminopeptidase